ncbi:unnamed protein product [Orchesella dallaii]|uniref:Uncharacterized protein n=1 Tax=Orchesella dallaii TaxID=48710 RepID=A0ABP1PR20_9HEXA
MKYLIALAFLIVAAQASPVKEVEKEKIDSKKNETVKYAETTTPLERTTRACEAADLNKIQAQLTTALEKEIEKLLSKTRRRRDTSSAAGASSEVGPDGKTKSAAFAKSKTGEKEPALLKEGPPTPVLGGSEGKPGTPLAPLAGAPVPAPDGSVPPPPAHDGVAPPPPAHDGAAAPPPAHDGAAPPPPALPVDGKGNTVQNVKSAASMEKGTAVASAVAKREAVVQTVGASANKAVATGTSHKGGADTTIQKIEAAGGEMGIASASVDEKNSTAGATKIDPATGKPVAGVVVQNVKATGQKAVATADNKKNGGNSIQEAGAEGEELAIASVSSGSDSPAVPEPSKLVKRDVTAQTVGAKGNKAVATAEAKTKNNSTTIQQVDATGNELAVASATTDTKPDAAVMAPLPLPPSDELRKERSLCGGLKMNDEIRLLVRTTVENAFTELKQGLKLNA